MDCNAEENRINLNLMEHISPITWENAMANGKYFSILDPSQGTVMNLLLLLCPLRARAWPLI